MLILMLLITAGDAAAEIKIFQHSVDQPFSGSQSPDDAYVAALSRAKSEVLEEAGTYLESLSVVDNFVLKRDEVIALAAGILKTQVVSRRNYATDKTFGIVLKTRIEVDTSMVEKRMQRLLEDQALLRKYDEMQLRQKELLARIKELETENSKPGVHNSGRRKLGREFARTSAALAAAPWYEKALELWSNGAYTDPIKAIEYLNKAIELDPAAAHFYNSRAVAYMSLEQYDNADSSIRTALKLNSHYADACNNLGSLYYRRGLYGKASLFYNRALKLQPDFYDALMNRAMCRRKLLRYEDAITDFRRAVALAPAAAHDGVRVQLNGIDKLCAKARTACDMGLCRALNFLHQRDLCIKNSRDKE